MNPRCARYRVFWCGVGYHSAVTWFCWNIDEIILSLVVVAVGVTIPSHYVPWPGMVAKHFQRTCRKYFQSAAKESAC